LHHCRDEVDADIKYQHLLQQTNEGTCI